MTDLLERKKKVTSKAQLKLLLAKPRQCVKANLQRSASSVPCPGSDSLTAAQTDAVRLSSMSFTCWGFNQVPKETRNHLGTFILFYFFKI